MIVIYSQHTNYLRSIRQQYTGKGCVIMARLMLYKNAYADTTVVSNSFIDDYMKEANAVQVKVYLYLLRMLNASQAVTVSDMADHFNETEKDILRALKYWEDQQLFGLD